MKTQALASSGPVALRVAGDGVADGDYELRVKMSAQTAWSGTSPADLAPGGEATFAFAAPTGSTADVTLTPGKKSAFAPLIVDVEGAGGTLIPVDGSGAKPKKHAVKGVILGPAGEYLVRFRNSAAAAGSWAVSVRVHPPHLSRANVDISDSSLTGSFGGGAQVFGRVLDPTGGDVDPGVTGGALDGSSILVPVGALGAPTAVAIEASETFFVDDANHPAGIAVAFTPSGTVFPTPVTVTLPFDAQSFDDPANELTIYVKDGTTGALEAVPRTSLAFDLAAGTVSFPASHFSNFQSTSPRDRPFKGQFVELEIAGAPSPSYGGTFSMGLHQVTGFKGPRTGNGFSRTLGRSAFQYGGGTITAVSAASTEGGNCDVVDDADVTLTGDASGARTYLRGRNDGVFVAAPSAAAATDSESVIFRVAQGAPTFANVAGEWLAYVYEVSARENPTPDQLEVVGRRTRLFFGVDGSVRAGVTATETASAKGDGSWTRSSDATHPRKGTFSVAGGLVHLDMQVGTSPLSTSVDLVAVLRGDGLVGVTSGVKTAGKKTVEAMTRTVFLVRASSGAKEGPILGRSFFSEFAVTPVDRVGASQDLSWIGEALTLTHVAPSTIDVAGTRATFDHDATGAPRAASSSIATTGTFLAESNGVYRELDANVFGAFAPREGFYVSTRFGPTFLGMGFGVVARPAQ